jgi:hypothetical protein
MDRDALHAADRIVQFPKIILVAGCSPELRLSTKLQWSMLLWGHTPPDEPKEEMGSLLVRINCPKGLNKFHRTAKAVREDTLVTTICQT